MIITVPIPGVGASAGGAGGKGYGVVVSNAGGTPSADNPTWANNGASSFFVNATAGSTFQWIMFANTV
jgi:hypothetical protein